MITPASLFSVRESSEGGVHRLTPIGELDLSTAPLLESAFDAVLTDEDAEMIVVDLTKLSFMDSTGIHLLIRMHGACADVDRLRVINGSRSVQRILDLTGVRAHLPIISSDCDPLASLPDDTPIPSSP
jgi:anti-sigma B factor antagonist